MPAGSALLKKIFFNFYYLFMWLCWVLGVSCILRDLGPRPGIEPWAPALAAQSLSHWTSREIPSHPPTGRGALSRSSASGGPWPLAPLLRGHWGQQRDDSSLSKGCPPAPGPQETFFSSPTSQPPGHLSVPSS